MPSMHDPETFEAITALLEHGELHGYGVQFEPVDEGWRIGWVRQMQGGHLVIRANLHDAAVAAFEPLLAVMEARGH